MTATPKSSPGEASSGEWAPMLTGGWGGPPAQPSPGLTAPVACVLPPSLFSGLSLLLLCACFEKCKVTLSPQGLEAATAFVCI